MLPKLERHDEIAPGGCRRLSRPIIPLPAVLPDAAGFVFVLPDDRHARRPAAFRRREKAPVLPHRLRRVVHRAPAVRLCGVHRHPDRRRRRAHPPAHTIRRVAQEIGPAAEIPGVIRVRGRAKWRPAADDHRLIRECDQRRLGQLLDEIPIFGTGDLTGREKRLFDAIRGIRPAGIHRLPLGVIPNVDPHERHLGIVVVTCARLDNELFQPVDERRIVITDAPISMPVIREREPCRALQPGRQRLHLVRVRRCPAARPAADELRRDHQRDRLRRLRAIAQRDVVGGRLAQALVNVRPVNVARRAGRAGAARRRRLPHRPRDRDPCVGGDPQIMIALGPHGKVRARRVQRVRRRDRHRREKRGERAEPPQKRHRLARRHRRAQRPLLDRPGRRCTGRYARLYRRPAHRCRPGRLPQQQPRHRHRQRRTDQSANEHPSSPCRHLVSIIRMPAPAGPPGSPRPASAHPSGSSSARSSGSPPSSRRPPP